MISGSDDVKVLQQKSLGSYKLLNQQKAYQISDSSFIFKWTPKFQKSEFGWSVSEFKGFWNDGTCRYITLI